MYVPSVSITLSIVTLAVDKSFFSTVAVAPPSAINELFSAKVPDGFETFNTPVPESYETTVAVTAVEVISIPVTV